MSSWIDNFWYILNGEATSNFEENFDSVNEEKDDNDEHETGIAAVKDVSVELMMLILCPQQNKLRNEQWVGYKVKRNKSKKWFWEEPRSVPSNGL